MDKEMMKHFISSPAYLYQIVQKAKRGATGRRKIAPWEEVLQTGT